jgi:hypothetical protein
MNLFDYSYTINETTPFSSICYKTPDFNKYKNFFVTYIISSREEFRPDVIAYELYGDDSLSWVLDEINHVYHPSFYKRNKEIFFLPVDYLIDLGVY